MDNIYLVILIILMALAVSDLVVGVSNDAVNFLNSALGSKAAPRWLIMVVASAGILLGSIFSSGMMEVARSGVFYPSQFHFHDMMLLFLAVMFTDVILLDMFNTFGLPTSTTVSLVFELLGAGVAVALYTMPAGEHISTYINAGKAMGIISGILSSVVIAFVTGTVVMFVTRAIFSFRYQRSFKYVGAFWCGIALTAISYFAIFKGLKGSTIMSAELVDFLNNSSTIFLLSVSFVFWTLTMGFIQWVFKFNILRLTVLAGTMSLALAFAGNDLVNFIGVFMAGKSTYDAGAELVAQGGDLSTLKMTALEGKVTVDWIYLFAAGLIMTITLWFSKKAQRVTETEISLARQDSGVERFGSTALSRALVRSAVNFNKKYERYTPTAVQRYIERRFRPIEELDVNQAPFDLIRATVNLTCASILIAMATSLKLPLSTTYVTFMVAMGSSLADRAWGRESAVYRITGVLTVISGWFLTAFIAFTVAFIVAMILMAGGEIAIYVMAAICAYLLIQSKILFSRRRKKEAQQDDEYEELTGIDIVKRSQEEITTSMEKMTDIYSQTITGLLMEDRKLLKDMMRQADEMYEKAHERKHKIMPVLRQLEEHNISQGHYFVQVADYLNEVAKALVHITRPSYAHIDNNHQGLSIEQADDLRRINLAVSHIYERFNNMLKTDNYTDLGQTLEKRDKLFELLADVTTNQVKRVIDNDSSARSSMLFLNIITETKTMLLQSRNLIKSQKHFIEQQ
ncbi:putative low-affinity inorganic phosphate transporter [Mucinivorans hirudinis]|uniref:Phosphate transporter n=1 Tax=Mucinivorans hirudinis TaxID=1433126 RepID=A0A060RC16_9BACT|nr:putative low-affinity inorganic phosphate transporter [Mucinivorans hirudinis]